MLVISGVEDNGLRTRSASGLEGFGLIGGGETIRGDSALVGTFLMSEGTGLEVSGLLKFKDGFLGGCGCDGLRR